MSKLAVVVFNLGGPDCPESVRPFLFNLFNDPAIVGLPNPFRTILAHIISRRRAPVAREIYAHLGGGSPLLPLTNEQASALEQALSDLGETRVFVSMRYWHPMSDETALAVKDFAPEAVILLPLYPQFSTTTSGSSFRDWRRAARAAGLDVPNYAVCCYPTESGFIAAQADLLKKSLGKMAGEEKVRVLFSAHGLPKRVVERGDPYAWQVEQTAGAVVQALGMSELDWLVSYQSRVGPLEWIGPSTEDEVERAGEDNTSLIVVPIAFVSEHSETLVELDIEYGELAKKSGVPMYERVPAVGTHVEFIAGLSRIVRAALTEAKPMRSEEGPRCCPASCVRCPNPAESSPAVK